jgi:uncharacterized NAD(P)/FAD-binding protein YdhS
MRKRVAIVGSGPTAIFALQELITCTVPLSISVFESSAIAGKGTPYQYGINDPVMLSNIPSVEIPNLPEKLVDWLRGTADEYLDGFALVREEINDRSFYPRVVLGDFFRAQFERIVEEGKQRRHTITVVECCRVTDAAVVDGEFELCYSMGGHKTKEVFDYLVAATGHSFPTDPETSPGYFSAPWPAEKLKSVPCGPVGILGTSLSAIDAVMTVATNFGAFRRGRDGKLTYAPHDDCERFSATMMSRKGLLPEADFYFPIPYEAPRICTVQAVEERCALGASGLLDDIFDLFRKEIARADPQYAAQIGLEELTVDTFAAAYYGQRDHKDPFVWAEQNLVEAATNYRCRYTVSWRYAILITHEIIETAVSHLNADDLLRFNRSFKGIFADEYATVPHLSIERLLALRAAGKLSILALGDDSQISLDGLDRGATVLLQAGKRQFQTFIDATGQQSLSADDAIFPSLVDQGLIREARTLTARGNHVRTGGIDVDARCRPAVTGITAARRLFIPAVSYLLHKRPFIQGITSAAELGKTVGESIKEDVTRLRRTRRRSVGASSVAKVLSLAN